MIDTSKTKRLPPAENRCIGLCIRRQHHGDCLSCLPTYLGLNDLEQVPSDLIICGKVNDDALIALIGQTTGGAVISAADLDDKLQHPVDTERNAEGKKRKNHDL